MSDSEGNESDRGAGGGVNNKVIKIKEGEKQQRLCLVSRT